MVLILPDMLILPHITLRYGLDVANVVENVLHILLHPHVHSARTLHKV
jgi:hypothetical protein